MHLDFSVSMEFYSWIEGTTFRSKYKLLGILLKSLLSVLNPLMEVYLDTDTVIFD